MNSVCRLNMPLVDLCLHLIRLEWVDDVIVTSFKFSANNFVHISNSIEPTKFILGTNGQLHTIHLLIRVKVTLK